MKYPHHYFIAAFFISSSLTAMQKPAIAWLKIGDNCPLMIEKKIINQMRVLQVFLAHQHGDNENSEKNPVVLSRTEKRNKALGVSKKDLRRMKLPLTRDWSVTKQELDLVIGGLEANAQPEGCFSYCEKLKEKNQFLTFVDAAHKVQALRLIEFLCDQSMVNKDAHNLVQAHLAKPIINYAQNKALALAETKCIPLNFHTDWVHAIQLSPDGKKLISSSHNNRDGNQIILYHMATKKQIIVPNEHDLPIHTIVFNPDSTLFSLLAPQSNNITFRNSTTGQIIKTIPINYIPHAITFNHDGTKFISCGKDGKSRRNNNLILWNAVTNKIINVLPGHQVSVNHAEFNHDGTQIISAGYESLILWDGNGNYIARLEGHLEPIRTVTFNHDGTNVIAAGMCSEESSLFVWNTITAKKVATMKEHTGAICAVQLNPDGKTFCSSSSKGSNNLIIWDSATGKRIKILSSPQLSSPQTAIYSIAFNPDGTKLASSSPNENNDNNLILWDMIIGKKIKKLTGHSSAACDTAFSPDGKTVIATGRSSTIFLWEPFDTERDKLIKETIEKIPTIAEMQSLYRLCCATSWDYQTMLADEGRYAALFTTLPKDVQTTLKHYFFIS